jgi:hypothetical protein
VAGEFGWLLESATQSWGGIIAAIEAGDLGLALEVAVAGLRLIWAQGWAWASQEWENWKNDFLRGWDLVTGWLGDAWGAVVTEFAKSIQGLATFFAWLWKRIKGETKEGFKEMAARVKEGRAELDRLRDAESKSRWEARRQADQDRIRASQANSSRAVEEAKAELDRLTKEAEWQKWLANFMKELEGWTSSASSGSGGLGMGEVKTAGTFSGMALGGLGVGRVQERIATASEETARNTGRLVDAGGERFD